MSQSTKQTPEQIRRRVLEHHARRIVACLLGGIDSARVAQTLIADHPEALSGGEGGWIASQLSGIETVLRQALISVDVHILRDVPPGTHEVIHQALREAGPICRRCGCTESEPCVVTESPDIEPDDDGWSEMEMCHWVEPDLCSACAGDQEGEG